MNPSLAIIIPVHNEGPNITTLLDQLNQHLTTPAHLYICYDHEADSTLPVVRARPQSHLPVSFVLNPEPRLGPATAILAGIHEALQTPATACLVFPADDHHNAPILDAMFAACHAGADIVLASRFIPGGCMRGCPPLKAALVRTASWTLRHFARLPVHDATSGFRLFSRRLLERTPIESRHGFAYALELLVKAHRLRLPIVEIPAQWHQRHHGTSRFRIGRWLRHYLRWYRYAFATTWLRRRPPTIPQPQNTTTERQFFDRVASSKYGHDPFDTHGYQRLLHHLLRGIDLSDYPRIADLGCGTGAFTQHLHRAGAHELHGIDLSPACIETARQTCPQATFTCADLHHLPFPNAHFDLVLCSGVLHHFPNPTPALHEARRVLRPGGLLLAFDPHRRNPAMYLYRAKSSPFYSSRGVTPNEQPITRNELTHALHQTHFTNVHIRPTSGITFRSLASPRAERLLPLYNALERCLALPPLERHFGSFLITRARKPIPAAPATPP